jgi:glycosyltransferase involved in cell wall biosynthesis
MKINQPDISIVVPVYNNAQTLPTLYQRLSAVAAQLNIHWELILVNDGSTDSSLETARQLVSLHKEVRTLNLTKNLGQHSAVLLGLNSAAAEWCMIIDADLQDPPERLIDLWDKHLGHYDTIFAGRRGSYESMFRLLTGKVYRLLMSAISPAPVDAGISMLVSRPVIQRILKMAVSRPFIPVMVAFASTSMLSVPVKRDIRMNGKSGYTFLKRLKAAECAFRCVWEIHYSHKGISYLDNLEFNPVQAHYSHFS